MWGQVWGEKEESTILRFLTCAKGGGSARNCVWKTQRDWGLLSVPVDSLSTWDMSLAFRGQIWARDTNVGESLASLWH